MLRTSSGDLETPVIQGLNFTGYKMFPLSPKPAFIFIPNNFNCRLRQCWLRNLFGGVNFFNVILLSKLLFKGAIAAAIFNKCYFVINFLFYQRWEIQIETKLRLLRCAFFLVSPSTSNMDGVLKERKKMHFLMNRRAEMIKLIIAKVIMIIGRIKDLATIYLSLKSELFLVSEENRMGRQRFLDWSQSKLDLSRHR